MTGPSVASAIPLSALCPSTINDHIDQLDHLDDNYHIDQLDDEPLFPLTSSGFLPTFVSEAGAFPVGWI